MKFVVSEDIETAESLPAETFTDAAFLRRELERIFKTNWLLIPERAASDDDARSMSDIVKLRGAHAPFSLLGQPFFLQRDWKDKLHCFPNVCTHAWYPLIEGPGRQKSIVCQQHGRSFNCEGRFVAQSGFTPKTMRNFPRDCDHLQKLAVGQWQQFFFACLGKPAQELDKLLSPMKESVSKLPLDDFKRRGREEVREVEGNWKQHGWNYMDKFHIAFIHRAPGGLADAIDMSSYTTELHGLSSLQWAYAADPDHGFDPKHLAERFRDPQRPGRRVFALWWFVFPNMTFNFYPWGLSINAYMPVPGEPLKTLFLWYHYVWDEKKYAKREEHWLSSQVDAEDIHAMQQMRRGARSSFAPRGRFAPGEEAGPHWFHRLVAEAIA